MAGRGRRGKAEGEKAKWGAGPASRPVLEVVSAGLAGLSEPAASTRGVADQIRATLEKAAAVAGDISSNCFLANELEGSRGSQGRMAPLGCAGRPCLP